MDYIWIITTHLFMRGTVFLVSLFSGRSGKCLGWVCPLSILHVHFRPSTGREDLDGWRNSVPWPVSRDSRSSNNALCKPLTNKQTNNWSTPLALPSSPTTYEFKWTTVQWTFVCLCPETRTFFSVLGISSWNKIVAENGNHSSIPSFKRGSAQ